MAAIMAEPMDQAEPMDSEEEGSNEPDEVFHRTWAQLEHQHPRTFVEIDGRPDHYLATGEFVCLRHPVSFVAKAGPDSQEMTLQSTVARILTVEQNDSETNVWLNLLVAANAFPQFPLSPVQPPPLQTYIQFPLKLVWTNLTVRLNARQVLSEAFVFRHRHILFNDAGICVGMENAFFVRIRWTKDPPQWSKIPAPGLSSFGPFPFHDCYSRRSWEVLLNLTRLISYEMSKSSIAQRSTQNKKVDFTKTMWDYLRYRLQPEAEVIEKNGVSTLLHLRKNGTKEVIKCRILKGSIRLDTSALFDLLQRVLGSTIALGLRRPNPTAPTLRARKTLSYDSLRPSNEDSFNLFYPLPAETLDGRTHRPRHPGVDFKYDSNKRELRVAFRFRRAPPFDPVVAAHVGALPAPPHTDDSSDGSEDSDNNEGDAMSVTSVIDNIALEEGDHLGNDDYLLTVRRILSGATHLVVNVVESQDHNFAVGTERILTMTRAHELYRQYNDL
jgi:hypothetical protein